MGDKPPINPVVAGIIIVVFLAVVGYLGFKAVAPAQYHGGPVNMGAIMKKGGAPVAPPRRPGMPGGAPGGMPGRMPGGMPGGAPGGMPGGAPGGAPAGAPGAGGR